MSHETIMMIIAALGGFAFARREYLISFSLIAFVALKVIYLES